ncbi:MAG: hypothetical protein HUU31_25820 [Anaerolineae bacterium]|nr:hypothetical protein [Anaerolineae bacterium]
MILNADVYGYADPAAAIRGDTSAALVLLSTGTKVLVQARWDGNENIVKAVRVGEVSPVFWFNSGDGNVTRPDGEDCNDLPFETQAGHELSTYGIEAPNRDQVLGLLGSDPSYAATLLDEAGVTTSNVIDWQSGEVNRIHQGAVDIALAFTSVRDGIALQTAFRQGMGIDTNGGSAARGIIRFIRTSHLPYCVNVLNAIPRTIVCGTIARGFSHYLAVHELGHVFDNQADQGGDENQGLGAHVTFAQVLDETNQWVLGNYPPGAPCGDGTFVTTGGWGRGERGWGSGPGSVYALTGIDERCQTPQAPNFTNFQQNPPPYQVASGLTPQQVAAQETGADMFLNWVYRVQERGGFQNRNWKPKDRDPATGLYCDITAEGAGCPDARNPGNTRLAWMQSFMATTLVRLIT